MVCGRHLMILRHSIYPSVEVKQAGRARGGLLVRKRGRQPVGIYLIIIQKTVGLGRDKSV